MDAVKIVWATVAFVGAILLMITAFRKRRGGRTFDIGPGAYGSVYDLLNQDKRKAIEVIVEEKAEARDPEDADGNLPDLERRRERTP